MPRLIPTAFFFFAAVTLNGDQRTHMIYFFGTQVAAEARVDGNAAPVIEQEYVWFGDRPVAQFDMTSQTTRWTAADEIRTPIVQTGANGAVLWRAERDPYGEFRTFRAGADVNQPLRMPGQEKISDASKLTYNDHRWYRAEWGRYTQADPLGLDASDSTLYSYARNNPVRFTDPSGLTTYEGFSPEQEIALRNAVAMVLHKLSQRPCCVGSDSQGADIASALETAHFVHKPEVEDCGVVSPIDYFRNTIVIGGAFVNPGCRFSPLHCTVLHEANHLTSSNFALNIPFDMFRHNDSFKEQDSYWRTYKCFGCVAWRLKGNEPRYEGRRPGCNGPACAGVTDVP